MTSGDREKKLSARTEAEMRRGAEIVEQNVNAQCQVIARHVLSEAFNPSHTAGNTPDVPNGRISLAERRRRDEYRQRLAGWNGGQNK